MRVLVTGSAGMLGSAIVRALEVRGSHVFAYRRSHGDLSKHEPFNTIIRDFRPDLVIHSAAKVGGIEANIREPLNFLLHNVQMDSNVISTCIERGIENFIYFGSSCMYPRDIRQPFEESDLLQAPLEPTNEGYAIAKITGAKLCEFASGSHGLHYKTLVPSNLYGPGDNFDPHSSHLLASVMRKVHDARRAKLTEISVWGTGSARREYTYVNDLASWLASNILELQSWPNRLNVGSGIDYSVDELFHSAMKVIGYEVPLVHDTSRPEGMPSKLMNSELARLKFGWSPSTELTVGISDAYDWLLQDMRRSVRTYERAADNA